MSHTALPLILATHEFSPRRGGIATYCEEIALASARRGGLAEVWAPGDASAEDGRRWPFPIRRLTMRGTHGPACQWRMASEMFRRRKRLRASHLLLAEPGPILAWRWIMGWSGCQPARLSLALHGSEIIRFHRNPLQRRFFQRLIPRVDRIFVLTAFTRGLLVEHFPKAADRIVLSPGALRASFANAPSIQDRPHSPSKRFVVLSVGRLHPRKGQLETLRALRALPADLRARLECHIVGSGERRAYAQTLRKYAAQCGFPVAFSEAKNDADLSRHYAAADLFAFTSMPSGASVEGFGLACLEAAAHGLPVVGHAIGGIPEAVVNGETGLLTRPGDTPALSAAFARLIADANLRSQLGQQGRIRALNTSWDLAAALLFQ